jgi:hypothetical protein
MPVFKKKVEEIKQRKAVQVVLKHVKDNKTEYLVGVGALLGAGITVLVMRSSAAHGGASEGNALGGLTNTASRVFSNKQTINVTTVLDREGRGHPGWPVRNTETCRIFASQREAANVFGIPEGRLSGQIKGVYPDVDGLTFERISFPTQ